MSGLRFVLLLVLVLSGCRESANPEIHKLTVAYTTQPQCTLLHVAQAKGFFAEEKLDVQPRLFTFGKMALQELLEDRADLATAAETPIMFNILKGEKIFVLANIDTSTTNNAIVARKDAGIVQPTDLAGKRIALSPGTTSDFFLSTFLIANGLSRQQIHELPLKPEEMQEAIVHGRVDAISTWNYPLTQIVQALGANGTTFFDRDIYTETYNLVAKQEFVQKNPAILERFLRALIKAERFTQQQPLVAQEIVAQAIHVNRELVRSVWNNFGYRIVLDQILLIMLEDETRWAMSHGLAKPAAMPDYLSYIHFDALKAVKPEAIRIKR
ncbi:MAG: NrtA/SsuA/CpmA family ABC transporter substrate-binding protein [Magnetococcales bacterium]|nr:NrtA/SsuA/CpmA family ABC transporter substrate-binding protein [Magnetococcales bacterium]